MSRKQPEISPFVLDIDATFQWPVTVHVPSSNVGKKLTTRFIAEFRHVSQERRLEILSEHREEIKRLQKSISADSAEAQPEQDAEDQIQGLFNLSQRVLDEVLVGFQGIIDRDKRPIEFSPEVKQSLITHQMVWPRIFKAYNEAIGTQDSRGN